LALARDPSLEQKGPVSLWLLGFSLQLAGHSDAAMEVLRRGQRAYPEDYWLNNELGNALLGARRAGPAALDSVINFDKIEGRFRAAEPYLMAAVALRPGSSAAHLSLADAFMLQGRFDEAVSSAEQAVRLKSDDAAAHNGLGLALRLQGKPSEASREFRAAIRLRPSYSLAHGNLGSLLVQQGKLEEAITEAREALRLWPVLDNAHITLIRALSDLCRFEEAVTAGREACRVLQGNALVRASLGVALRRSGDYKEAVIELRQALERIDDPAVAARLKYDLARAERFGALAARLPAVLRGEDKPEFHRQRLEFADLAYDRARFAVAARLFAEALEGAHALADDLAAANRYNAACAAALAASGIGKDEPRPDESARSGLRSQAFQWLKADLAAWDKRLQSDSSGDREHARQTFEHWKTDPDLAYVREPGGLARLGDRERKNWQELWAEVDRLCAVNAPDTAIPRALMGRWEGTIPTGQGTSLRVVIRVEPGADGRLAMLADSPDQYLGDLPVSSTSLKNGVWTWTLAGVNARFEGKADRTGDSYSGEFHQPPLLHTTLTLRRTGKPKSPPSR
jgi:tetratricopeptide (TPR) repeat protein